MDAVILAGGEGTRLKPYTVSIPKPLVPLGETPIVEIVLRQLEIAGVRRAYLALGHLAGLMKAYLEQVDRRYDLEIICVVEDRPLGTVAPVKLMPDLSENFLLLNGDLLTTLPFRGLMDEHLSTGRAATVAVHRRKLPIEFGVVRLDDESRIIGHEEKPTLEVTVGMGVCVFKKEVVDLIPSDRRFDVPDLFQALRDSGQEVGAYMSDDYWMDIGRAEDYEIAHRDFLENPARFLGD